MAIAVMGVAHGDAPRTGAGTFPNLSVFARALSHIERSYVDAVDQDALIHGAISGMLRSLDPHSAYFTPQELAMFDSTATGRFAGIGVEVDVRDGWLTISAVMEGSPAERSGLQLGDKFLAIGNRVARDMLPSEAARLIRGEPGTVVQLVMRRDGVDADVRLDVTRAVVTVAGVTSRVVDLRTGEGGSSGASGRVVYVKLRSFQDNVAREMRAAIDEAVASMRPLAPAGILLDLRDNPGGLLDEAAAIADAFMESGIIVTTRGRDGRELSRIVATATGTYPASWPVVILVNEYSASASEVLAGALGDSGRARLVGTRTFGKASVQNVVELPDGSAIKLTIARYFTPNGRSIQAHGIEPHFVVEQVVPGAVRTREGSVLHEADLPNHLRPTSTTIPDSAAPTPTEVPPAGSSTRPRTDPAATEGAFANDFQARMALSVLRMR